MPCFEAPGITWDGMLRRFELTFDSDACYGWCALIERVVGSGYCALLVDFEKK